MKIPNENSKIQMTMPNENSKWKGVWRRIRILGPVNCYSMEFRKTFQGISITWSLITQVLPVQIADLRSRDDCFLLLSLLQIEFKNNFSFSTRVSCFFCWGIYKRKLDCLTNRSNYQNRVCCQPYLSGKYNIDLPGWWSVVKWCTTVQWNW